MIKAVDSNRDPLMYRVRSGGRCSIHDLLSPIYEAIRDNGKKVKAGKEFTVYAKTLTGRTATIQVTGEDTIDEVKAKIEESYFDLLNYDKLYGITFSVFTQRLRNFEINNSYHSAII